MNLKDKGVTMKHKGSVAEFLKWCEENEFKKEEVLRELLKEKGYELTTSGYIMPILNDYLHQIENLRGKVKETNDLQELKNFYEKGQELQEKHRKAIEKTETLSSVIKKRLKDERYSDSYYFLGDVKDKVLSLTLGY